MARVFCPGCFHNFDTRDVSELTSIEDHGLCFNCHRMVKNGEMCGICFDNNHATHECDVLVSETPEDMEWDYNMAVFGEEDP